MFIIKLICKLIRKEERTKCMKIWIRIYREIQCTLRCITRVLNYFKYCMKLLIYFCNGFKRIIDNNDKLFKRKCEYSTESKKEMIKTVNSN